MALQECDYIWQDGKIIPWAQATTHVLSHSLHYGSAVFEGIRCYEGKDGGPSHVFRLQEHMERLIRSCKIAMIPIEYTAEELADATVELIRANNLPACYIRPLVYRGYGQMGVDPTGAPTNVAIAVWPWGAYLGPEALEKGIKVGISSWRQRSINAIPPAMKSSASYMNSLQAKLEAIAHGYDEAILLNEQGYVCEGSGENLFVVRDNILSTPPVSDGVLEGITRDTILCLADDLSEQLEIFVTEESLTRADLYIADEAFFSGTAAEVTPIASIDEREIGGRGPVAAAIQERFFQVARGEVEEYADWLTEV